MNPANYESFVDHEGGAWIRITHKSCRDVVWRPTDLNVTEDGQISFSAEFLEGPGIPSLDESNEKQFGNLARGIISDILAQEMAEVQTLAESHEQLSQDIPSEDKEESGIILNPTRPF